MTIAVAGLGLSIMSIVPWGSLVARLLRGSLSVGLLVSIGMVVAMQFSRTTASSSLREDSERIQVLQGVLTRAVRLHDATQRVVLHDSSCPNCARPDLRYQSSVDSEVIDV